MFFRAQNHACICGIVADCVQYGARLAALRILPNDARVKNFKRRCDVIGCIDHILSTQMSAPKWRFEHKGNLSLDTGLDEAIFGHKPVMVKQHIIKENSAVWNVDVKGRLHRFGRQPDFPSNDRAARCSFCI